LLRMTGPGVLVTHSAGGLYGWHAALAAPSLVRAVVAYEPAAFVFPEGDMLRDIPVRLPLVAERMRPRLIGEAAFAALTAMPLLIIYGDNIVKEPCDNYGADIWRVAVLRARQFAEAVNRRGGDARLVLLPDIGIRGNTHFPFMDLNNREITGHLEAFLREKNLADYSRPHQGPRTTPG